MGSLLGLASELLLLSLRQQRMSELITAAGSGPEDGSGPAGAPPSPDDAELTPSERRWLRRRADAVVSAWLAPFGVAP